MNVGIPVVLHDIGILDGLGLQNIIGTDPICGKASIVRISIEALLREVSRLIHRSHVVEVDVLVLGVTILVATTLLDLGKQGVLRAESLTWVDQVALSVEAPDEIKQVIRV